MLLHHGCSILGMVSMLFGGRWGCELTLMLLLSELSNPFLQLRWLLRHPPPPLPISDAVRLKVIRFCETAFVAVFGIARILIGTPLIWLYLRNPRTDFLGCTGAVVMYIIAWGFFLSILSFARRSLRQSKRNGKKNWRFVTKLGLSPVACSEVFSQDKVQCWWFFIVKAKLYHYFNFLRCMILDWIMLLSIFL